MRELLKEAAEVLRRGQADEQAILAKHIGDVLAKPELDAVEIVDKLEKLLNMDQAIFPPQSSYTEAAALIASYSRRVPRAMLVELWDEGHFTYYSDSEERDACGDEIASAVERIAAKYGYRAE